MDHSGHDHHASHDHHAQHDHNAHQDMIANVTSSITTTIASVVNDHLFHSGHEDHGNVLNTSMSDMAANITSTVSSVINHVAAAAGHDHMNMNGAHDHMNMNGGHDHMGGMDHMDMDMPMYFQFTLKATILFKEWNVSTAGGMVGSVIGVMILAILYEGLKFLREYLFRISYSRLSYSTCAVTGVENNVGDNRGVELHKVTENKMLGFPHLLQTALHVVQIILSYFLMLIFMTFNLWLCFGVVLGSAIGYFFFGWRRSTVVDISDHCH